MDLYEIFRHPFKLTSRRKDVEENYKGEYHKFKTEEIKGDTTKEEVYVLSKIYLDNFIKKFKDYQIENEEITESTFYLYAEIVEDYELNEKHIYSVAYNNTKNIISFKNKFNDDFPIKGNFKICIQISCYVFYYEDDEDHSLVKNVIKEDDCVICYENKPNILFLDCLHFCVCNECNSNGGLSKCPLCRKKLIKGKILI